MTRQDKNFILATLKHIRELAKNTFNIFNEAIAEFVIENYGED